MANDTDLIAAIYDASIDPTGWDAVVKRIAEATKSIGGGLVTHRVDSAQLTSICNVDPFYAKAYVENYHKISPLAAVAWSIGPGEVRTHSYITQTDSYKASAFFNEWARPQGWADIIAIGMSRTRIAARHLRLPRSRDAVWVEPAQWRLLETLAPHLKRAASVQELLFRAKATTESLGKAVAAAGFAVFLLTEDCRVLFANAKAEDLIRRKIGLFSERGHLAAATPVLTARLHALAREGTQPRRGSGDIGGTLELSHGEKCLPLIAHVFPLAANRAVSIFDIETAAAAVFVVDQTAEFGAQIQRFATKFELTAAEARVLVEIISGNGLVPAAARLRVSKATARTHAARIFAKTGTERQTELIRRFFENSLPCLPPHA